MHRRRILLLVIVMIGGFTAISARLVWLQGFQWRHYHLEAESYHRRVWSDPAPRGMISDRNGQPISLDEPAHQIVYALDDLEKVRWACRRVRREIIRDRSGSEFPYDAESLWDSLESLRASLRPQFGFSEDLGRHLWLSRLPSPAAASLARAVRSRPQSYPGIVVLETAGEVWIDPGDLFAGEIAVRKIERRLGLAPGALFDRVWAKYQTVQDKLIPKDRREEIYRYLEHLLVDNVPSDLVQEIVTQPEHYPGLRVREGSRRLFQGPPGIAGLVGRVGSRRERDEKAWSEAREPIVDRMRFRNLMPLRVLEDRAHHSQDLVGHDGLERRFEEELRGRSGGTLWIVDHRQNPRGDPLDIEAPQPGTDLTLTLDLDLCRYLGELTATRDPYAASILVADCRTGELLGWESYPAAVPQVFRNKDEYNRLRELNRGHFFDRPANYAMDPGSTFKALVAIAALEEGVITADEKITCEGLYDPATPGRLRCNNHAPYLDLDLEEALMRSCNVYFYRVGGDRLGISKMDEWARRAGFWQPVDCGVGSEAVGVSPRSSAQSVAIGRTFTTTPLQMLRFTTIVANRGRDPGLTLVFGAGGTPLPTFQAKASTWETVISGMERAAHDPKGTAAKAQYGLRKFDCAVKTGTAGIAASQKFEEKIEERWRSVVHGQPVERNRAWLIGFAPAENPLISFVIGLERVEGHGGEECAPIAAKILEWLAVERGLDFRLPEEKN